MATRGRKPKPTELRLLEGVPGHSRPINENEPKPPKTLVLRPPAWMMPEAKKCWKKYAPILNDMGVITEVDIPAFEGFCQSYAMWKAAQQDIMIFGMTTVTKSGYEQQRPAVAIAQQNLKSMQSFATEFGLTPSSRSRITTGAAAGADEMDPMEALLTGRM